MEAWEAWKAWEAAWETQKEGRPRATSCSVSIFFNKTHGSSDSRFSHDSEKRKKGTLQGPKRAAGTGPIRGRPDTPMHACGLI